MSCVVEHDPVASPVYVLDDRAGQLARGFEGRVLERHRRRVRGQSHERDAILVEDQQAVIGAGGLETNPHQPLEHARQFDLARKRLGGAEQANDIEVHGAFGRARRAHRGPGEPRELPRERAHLGSRAPADVAAHRVRQVGLGGALEPDAPVHPAAALERERRVLQEPFAGGHVDGFLVQARRVERATFDLRDLGLEQANLVERVLRA